MYRRLIASFFFALVLVSVSSAPVYAQTSPDLAATPAVIDEKAKARDIMKKEIVLKNTSNHKLFLYPIVNDVLPESGQKGFVSALNGTEAAASLANWIELSRGVVELSPGEEKTIPFVIHANLTAIPDTYHANISFGQGTTREQAEAGPKLAVIAVNVEILADVKEVMQLNKFITDSIYFAGDDVRFSYQFENIGNEPVAPAGEIRIFDRRGAEVTSLEINKEGKTVAPNQMTQLASVWSATEGYGKFKGLLTVHYGSDGKGTLQDTVFFWIIPWKQLLALFVIGIIAVILFVIYFHGKFSIRRRHEVDLDTVAPAAPKDRPIPQDVYKPKPAPEPVVSPQPPRLPRPSILARITKPFSKIGRFFGAIGSSIASLFKRRPRRDPVASHIELEDTSVRAEIPEERNRKGLREALESTQPLSQRASGQEASIHDGVIDLKRMRTQERDDTPPGTGHVINLKKR